MNLTPSASRARAVWPPVALALATIVAACGGDGDVATASRAASSSLSTTAEAAPTTSVGPPQATTSLQRPSGATTTAAAVGATGPATSTSPISGSTATGRRETPPDGVPAQFAARIGAGPGPCYERRDRPKGVVPNSAVLGGQGTTVDVVHAVLCFEGFPADTPVEVRVDFPDGRTRNLTVPVLTPEFADPEDSSRLHWYVQPGDPVGDYQIFATQRGERITGSFRVRPVIGRYVYVLPPDLIPPAMRPPGSTFTVILLGFEPHAAVNLYVYQQIDSRGMFGFLRSVEARADGAGQGRFTLSTSLDDPLGNYCVILRERALRSTPGDDHTCAVLFPFPDLYTLAR